MKADLHVHTHYSSDGLTSPEALVERCLRLGIGCVAVTDHDGIDGALAVQGIAPFKVIVAHEVRTSDGEIIGLFLRESLPNGMTPEETVRAIRDQGGLVCVPHPFDRMRRSPLRKDALMRILPEVDIIEVFNARNTFQRDNELAARLASEHGKLKSAGSDAHTRGEIGLAYVEMPEFEGREDFPAALAAGQVVGRRAFFGVHLLSTWAKIRWRLRLGDRLERR